MLSKNIAENIKMTNKKYVEKENSYCLVYRKKKGNKRIRGVALVNKIASQRSLCIVCDSRKPTFLKQKPK